MPVIYVSEEVHQRLKELKEGKSFNQYILNLIDSPLEIKVIAEKAIETEKRIERLERFIIKKER